MDMIDILGGLLRKKTGAAGGGSGSSGGAILKDILTGGRSSPSGGRTGNTASIPVKPSGFPRIVEGSEQDEPEFKSLDDFLRHAHSGNVAQTENAPPPSARTQSPRGTVSSPGTLRPREVDITSIDGNERAEILVKAMINAAKADGQIDQAEQDAILKQAGTLTEQNLQFLKSEFSAPLNVRDFVWSVPIGMEQEAYTVSLMAINPDNNAEAMYLKQLAHGFRLTLAACNQIHQKYGAPLLK